jgi:alpha-D-xyloside xylohydrolase
VGGSLIAPSGCPLLTRRNTLGAPVLILQTLWLDAAEPERGSDYNFGDFRFELGTDTEIGEAWIQQHVRTFADGLATLNISGADYFVLPRSSWAGAWKYSAALWSGDIVSSFSELAMQVTVLQGVMMSGIQLWTTDIGGYWNGNPADPEFQDLIVRWFQVSASFVLVLCSRAEKTERFFFCVWFVAVWRVLSALSFAWAP